MSTKHRVKPGENLTGIAQQYNTTVDAIANANRIANRNMIYANTDLIIPDLPTPDNSNLGAIGGYNNPTAAPKIDPIPTNPTYLNGTWDESDKGSAAYKDYNDAKDTVANYGDFNFSETEWAKNIEDKIKNYGQFSYDFNTDALYQQYKDKYIQQGKMAMADTMGQAAAMTGGYGSSYAQTVGQQQYQASLDKLNDVIPDLYQLALDRYNTGKQDLYNQASYLMEKYKQEYGEYSDEYQRLLDSLGIAKDDYYSGADMFYTEQKNYNDVASKEFADAMAAWEAKTGQAWKQADWDEALRQFMIDQGWKSKEDARAERELAMKEEAWNLEEEAYRAEQERQNQPKQPAKQPSKQTQEEDAPDIESELNTYIKNGATKSEINNYLRQAMKAGIITQDEYNRLKELYAPRGNTY
jgi:LysM repeat protein